MKVSSYAVARPNYYDRSLSHTSLGYSAGGVAPHADTIRSSLTIAAGKKAFLDMGSLAMVRDGAATVAGLMYTYLQLAPGGVGATILLLVPDYSSVLGSKTFAAVAGSLSVVASDVLSLGTSDGSTGGTYRYLIYTHVTLFDA